MVDALPLFDRALTVTRADPTLTDLRLLLQINKAVTLGGLDQYEGALAGARQAQRLANWPASGSGAPRPTAAWASCSSIRAAGMRP